MIDLGMLILVLTVLSPFFRRLSVNRLLSETFVIRAKERLLRIRKRIEAAEPSIPIALLGKVQLSIYTISGRTSCALSENAITPG